MLAEATSWVPEWVSENWETITTTFGGRIWLWVILGIIICWYVTKFVRWVKNCIVNSFNAFIAFVSPLKTRRIFYNGVSMIFLVGGVSSACAAGSKLAGFDDSSLWAFTGGGASLAVYALLMLIFNNLHELRERSEKTKKPAK